MASSLVALNDTQLQAQVCSSEMSHCVALCPNQDLAGIGVRLAFYIQSFMSALLVVFSPSDSVPTAWAGTLLTASLVIAAFVQESGGNLTLHHAALILNFSTLSCISSLAVAPTLPIWRLTPGEYYEHDRTQHVLSQRSDELRNVFTSAVYSNAHKKRLRIEQKRGRVVLALALLLQVTFQWSWGIFLFVSWQNYSQPECSGDTTLVMFLASFTVRNINNLDMHGVKFLIWPLWIFCSLGITLALTILLALSSPYRAQAVFSRSTNATTAPSATTPVFIAWAHIARQSIPSWKDKARLLTMASYIVSFVLWSIYVASSELQKARNHIFDGENDFGGFGQITALCVSLAPLWSLTVALYKYPSRRRRQDRHRARLQRLCPSTLDGAPSAADVISPAVSRRTTRHFPEPSRRGTRHIPMPSDASSDEYEMYAVPAGRDSYVRLPTTAESPPMPRRALDAEPVRRTTVRGPRPPPSRT